MPGTIFGNSFKRQFLLKSDIKFHIVKAIINDNMDRFKYYISLLDNIDSKYKSLTVLNIACSNGRLKMVRLLLEKGATIDEDTCSYACGGGNIELLREVIRRGANVNTKNFKGYTPLMVTIDSPILKNMVEIINELIDNGANVNATLTTTIEEYNQREREFIIRYNVGTSPLIMASTHSNISNQEVVKLLLEKGATVDWTDSMGITALMKAAETNNTEIVKLLLKAGANKDIRDAHGATAYNYAKKREIKKMLTTEEVVEPEPMWNGWSQGDIAKFDSIFNQLEKVKGIYRGTDPTDVSYCPICLRYLERPRTESGEAGGCMYMHHDCSSIPGYYNEYLYDKYRIGTEINWCTICNRICGSHIHYGLFSSDKEDPDTIDSSFSPFAKTCKPYSGGLEEKVIRMKALRDKAYELNALKGTITQEQAMDQLVEAAWNAPLYNTLPEDFAEKILKTKTWNRPTTNYPMNAPPTATAVTLAPDVPVPPERKMPVKIQGTNALSMDDGEVLLFFHPVAGSGKSYHETVNPASLVSKESLTEYITNRITRFRNLENPLGTCWDTTCKAIMYPVEIKDHVSPELYEEYRLKFNMLMAEKRGGSRQLGGNSTNLILPLTDAVCSVPPRVKRNIGGTRRKRKQRRATTYRRK
jgi:ankyrin repeat protein